jgi:outer membrane immunogenic protein
MQIRNVLLASTAGVVVAPVAQAADLPLKSAPMVVPHAVSWTGWYVGGHLGGAWQQGDAGVGGATGYNSNHTSFMGGGQLGFNWQRGNFVYGWEADISGFTRGRTQTTSYLEFQSHIEWLSTIRGRMGLALNDTMVYVTGGLAIGGVRNIIHDVSDPSLSDDKTSTKTRVGWVIGGGIEHMWSRRWTIGLEALVVDLGGYGSGLYNSCSNGTCPTQFSNQVTIGRFKMNYRF